MHYCEFNTHHNCGNLCICNWTLSLYQCSGVSVFETCHYTEQKGVYKMNTVWCVDFFCLILHINNNQTRNHKSNSLAHPPSLINLFHPHIFSLCTELFKPLLVTSRCLCASVALSVTTLCCLWKWSWKCVPAEKQLIFLLAAYSLQMSICFHSKQLLCYICTGLQII